MNTVKKTTEKEVSILVITYKTADRIKLTLNAIKDNCKDVNYEVIVVENGSNDNTLSILENEYKWIKIIHNKKNRFFSPAFNQASSSAEGKYLLILNSDVTLLPNSLRRLTNFLDNNNNIGCAAPLTIKKGKPENAYWRKRKLWDLVRNRLPFSVLFKNTETLKKDFKSQILDKEEVLFPDIVSDSCLLIRRELFEKIGRYDENMLMYFTEDDLSLKVRQENYKVAFLKSVNVLHEGSLTTKKEKPLKIFNIEANDRRNYFSKYNGHIKSNISYFFSTMEKYFLIIFRKFNSRD